MRQLFKRFFDIAIIFHEGQKKFIGLCLLQGLQKKRLRFLCFSEHGIRRRGLYPQMQCYQGILQPCTGGKQSLAPPDDLCISTLRQINLIFNHFYHGFAGNKNIDGEKRVRAENFGDFLCFPQQGIVIGGSRIENIQPCDIMLLQKIRTPCREGSSFLCFDAEGKPSCQKIAAEGNVFLSISFNLGIRLLQSNLRVCKFSL